MSIVRREEAQVLAVGQATLGELADRAHNAHNAVAAHLHGALQAAIVCGEVLLEAQSLVPKGEWNTWCADNLNIARSARQRYMRLAEFKDFLPPEALRPYQDMGGAQREPNMSRALRYLDALPIERKNPLTPSDATREEIRRLAAGGIPKQEICRLVGVSKRTVWMILDSAAAQRWQEQHTRRSRRDKEARQALERELRDNNARKVGGNLAHFYSRFRVLAQDIDKAREKETDHGVRRALAAAYASLVQGEDKLNEAIKTKASSP